MSLIAVLILASVMSPPMNAAGMSAATHTELTPRFASGNKVVNLSLQDADLREVLQTLAKIGGISIVIDPEVKGTVTAELSDVPWQQALHTILKSHGLAVEVDGRLWAGDGLDLTTRPRSAIKITTSPD
jgi:type II secretory pathway component GspD/PulD (secretin)